MGPVKPSTNGFSHYRQWGCPTDTWRLTDQDPGPSRSGLTLVKSNDDVQNWGKQKQQRWFSMLFGVSVGTYCSFLGLHLCLFLSFATCYSHKRHANYGHRRNESQIGVKGREKQTNQLIGVIIRTGNGWKNMWEPLIRSYYSSLVASSIIPDDTWSRPHLRVLVSMCLHQFWQGAKTRSTASRISSSFNILVSSSRASSIRSRSLLSTT